LANGKTPAAPCENLKENFFLLGLLATPTPAAVGEGDGERSESFMASSCIDRLANSFVIVYPYAQTTSGYCAVTNITEHDHVKQWLLEPTDHPAGDGSDTFYENFTKENSRVRQNSERVSMMKMGKAWTGSATKLDFNNQPEIIGDFTPSLITSLLVDLIIRDVDGDISSSGTLKNTTQSLISTISKAVNLDPSLLSRTKFGFLDQPLSNYTNNYQYGQILCGEYLNGNPTENELAVSVIDCGTYSPQTLQDVIIDCSIY